MTQPAGYTVQNVETIAATAELQTRLFTLGPGETIQWHSHSQVTDWYFVLAGTLSIETRAPRAAETIPVGGRYQIPLKVAHLISNRGEASCRFLLVQGVGTYDFIKVGG